MRMAAGGIDLDQVTAWLRAVAAAVAEEKDHLTRLDSAIGDADHGINLHRGFQAALTKLEESPPADIAAAFKTVGMALIGKVGGASGPLYGSFFLQLATACQGKERLALDDWTEALQAAVDGVKARGKAEAGDKTMIDALVPAVEALREAASEGLDLSTALQRSAEGARAGMEATIPLVARKGRASYLGERSAGHQDPGATSSHLLLRVAAETWKGTEGDD